MIHPRLLRLAASLAAFVLASSAAQAGSCWQEDADNAQDYVDQCMEVSPATRPPCNGDNPCQMIWDEIARGCAMLGNDAPDFCSDYSG